VNVSVVPITWGSRWKHRCHALSLNITTVSAPAVSSSGVNHRPIVGGTPSINHAEADICAPNRRTAWSPHAA
jgi:hypothetical protein